MSTPEFELSFRRAQEPHDPASNHNDQVAGHVASVATRATRRMRGPEFDAQALRTRSQSQGLGADGKEHFAGRYRPDYAKDWRTGGIAASADGYGITAMGDAVIDPVMAMQRAIDRSNQSLGTRRHPAEVSKSLDELFAQHPPFEVKSVSETLGHENNHHLYPGLGPETDPGTAQRAAHYTNGHMGGKYFDCDLAIEEGYTQKGAELNSDRYRAWLEYEMGASPEFHNQMEQRLAGTASSQAYPGYVAEVTAFTQLTTFDQGGMVDRMNGYGSQDKPRAMTDELLRAHNFDTAMPDKTYQLVHQESTLMLRRDFDKVHEGYPTGMGTQAFHDVTNHAATRQNQTEEQRGINGELGKAELALSEQLMDISAELGDDPSQVTAEQRADINQRLSGAFNDFGNSFGGAVDRQEQADQDKHSYDKDLHDSAANHYDSFASMKEQYAGPNDPSAQQYRLLQQGQIACSQADDVRKNDNEASIGNARLLVDQSRDLADRFGDPERVPAYDRDSLSHLSGELLKSGIHHDPQGSRPAQLSSVTSLEPQPAPPDPSTMYAGAVQQMDQQAGAEQTAPEQTGSEQTGAEQDASEQDANEQDANEQDGSEQDGSEPGGAQPEAERTGTERTGTERTGTERTGTERDTENEGADQDGDAGEEDQPGPPPQPETAGQETQGQEAQQPEGQASRVTTMTGRDAHSHAQYTSMSGVAGPGNIAPAGPAGSATPTPKDAMTRAKHVASSGVATLTNDNVAGGEPPAEKPKTGGITAQRSGVERE